MSRSRSNSPVTRVRPDAHGSRTIVIEQVEAENVSQEPEQYGVLHLRGDVNARGPRRVKWDENVVDNEGCGRKKSKICCIYHKSREVGESSDSESSSSSDSSSSDSDSNVDLSHAHDEHAVGHRCVRHGRSKKRSRSPNAYEKQPRYKSKPQPPSNPHPDDELSPISP